MKKRNFIFISVLLFILFGCSNESSHGNIIDVTPSAEPEMAELTLMVYMAADNDLETYAIQNLKAMEQSSLEGINIIVLLDRAEGYDETNSNWTDTRLLEVVHDGSTDSHIKSKRVECASLGLTNSENTELDMANPNVLRNFLEFGRSNYTAKKYALIIWGHGTGWRYVTEFDIPQNGRAVAIDDRTGTYMSIKELGEAVRGQEINVIGFDTCFGAVFENVYELKDCAEYTVACPGVTPSSGWDYKGLIENIISNDFSTQTIALSMAQSSSVQTTVFINNKLNDLMYGFEQFSKKLSDSIIDENTRGETLDFLFTVKSHSYSQYPCDMYIDIGAMADIYTVASNSEISNAANNLISILREATLAYNNSIAGVGVHLIPLTAYHTPASIHSPDYVKDENRTDQCVFIKESQWWVPTINGNSGSLLDKLFYMSF